MSTEKEKFIAQIKKNLEMNGFPTKRVSLPLEKMYEIADSKGLSFNAILDELKNEGIQSISETEKIVFFQEQENDENPFNMNPEMMEKAQDMLSKMSPDQLKEMQDMITNMSDEERAELMKKAKDMGMF